MSILDKKGQAALTRRQQRRAASRPRRHRKQTIVGERGNFDPRSRGHRHDVVGSQMWLGQRQVHTSQWDDRRTRAAHQRLHEAAKRVG